MKQRYDVHPNLSMLRDQARSLGSDVLICPAKTIVAIYRRHVIAQTKPAGVDADRKRWLVKAYEMDA